MLVWMSKGSAVMGAATYHARIVCGLGMLFEFRPTRFRDADKRAIWAGQGPMPGRELDVPRGIEMVQTLVGRLATWRRQIGLHAGDIQRCVRFQGDQSLRSPTVASHFNAGNEHGFFKASKRNLRNAP